MFVGPACCMYDIFETFKGFEYLYGSGDITIHHHVLVNNTNRGAMNSERSELARRGLGATLKSLRRHIVR